MRRVVTAIAVVGGLTALIVGTLVAFAPRQTPGVELVLTSGARAEAVAWEERLRGALLTQLEGESGEYSVTVREVSGLRSVHLDGDAELEPASTIKTFYAWAVLTAVERDDLALDDLLPSGVTVADCLRVMIEVSDNNCVADVRDLIGIDELNEFWAEGGFPSTYIVTDDAGVYETKRTTTDDLAELLVRLERGTLLTEEHTELLLSHLLSQAWRQRLSSGLPEGTVSATKSGQLPLEDGTVVEADTGIVYAPDGPYVLTVLGYGMSTPDAVTRISTTVFEHFTGDEATPWPFPAEQFVTAVDAQGYREPGSGPRAVIPAGTPVEFWYSDRLWFRLEEQHDYLWLPASDLTLRPEFDQSE